MRVSGLFLIADLAPSSFYFNFNFSPNLGATKNEIANISPWPTGENAASAIPGTNNISKMIVKMMTSTQRAAAYFNLSIIFIIHSSEQQDVVSTFVTYEAPTNNAAPRSTPKFQPQPNFENNPPIVILLQLNPIPTDT